MCTNDVYDGGDDDATAADNGGGDDDNDGDGDDSLLLLTMMMMMPGPICKQKITSRWRELQRSTRDHPE